MNVLKEKMWTEIEMETRMRDKCAFEGIVIKWCTSHGGRALKCTRRFSFHYTDFTTSKFWLVVLGQMKMQIS